MLQKTKPAANRRQDLVIFNCFTQPKVKPQRRKGLHPQQVPQR